MNKGTEFWINTENDGEPIGGPSDYGHDWPGWHRNEGSEEINDEADLDDRRNRLALHEDDVVEAENPTVGNEIPVLGIEQVSDWNVGDSKESSQTLQIDPEWSQGLGLALEKSYSQEFARLVSRETSLQLSVKLALDKIRAQDSNIYEDIHYTKEVWLCRYILFNCPNRISPREAIEIYEFLNREQVNSAKYEAITPFSEEFHSIVIDILGTYPLPELMEGSEKALELILTELKRLFIDILDPASGLESEQESWLYSSLLDEADLEIIKKVRDHYFETLPSLPANLAMTYDHYFVANYMTEMISFLKSSLTLSVTRERREARIKTQKNVSNLIYGAITAHLDTGYGPLDLGDLASPDEVPMGAKVEIIKGLIVEKVNAQLSSTPGLKIGPEIIDAVAERWVPVFDKFLLDAIEHQLSWIRIAEAAANKDRLAGLKNFFKGAGSVIGSKIPSWAKI